MREAVIVSGARTAVGEFGGSLKGVSVVELGRLVIKEAIIRAGLRPVITEAVKAARPTEEILCLRQFPDPGVF
jgi:acetyl-CoA C-acetyltransferase